MVTMKARFAWSSAIFLLAALGALFMLGDLLVGAVRYGNLT